MNASGAKDPQASPRKEPNKPAYYALSAVFIVGLIVVAAVASRWIDARLHLNQYLSVGRLGRVVGGVLGLTGFLLWVWAPAMLFMRGRGIPLEGRDGPILDNGTKHLVRVGPYRLVRNPMYVGYITCFAAAGLLLDSPTMLFVATPLEALHSFIFTVRYEERALARRFGEEYRRYCEEVPRFIPRLPFFGSRGDRHRKVGAAL